MIDLNKIKKLTQEKQTTEINIIREYFQHLFLYYFYQQKNAENFLFKGGTALRIVYQSPRFSEDLDFSGVKDGHILEEIIENTLISIIRNNIKCDLIESKKTSGGWLNIFEFSIYEYRVRIMSEVSYRKTFLSKEMILINSDFLFPYKICLLEPKLLVEEKIDAFLIRKKARDVFDLYFILRSENLRKFIDFTKKEMILKTLKNLDNFLIEKELKPFLPLPYQSLLKGIKEKIVNEF